MTIHETCAGYWQGCFVCADYLPDRVFFCRRANLARFGSGYVETEEAEGEGGGRPWKSGGECRTQRRAPGGQFLKDGAQAGESGREGEADFRKSGAGAWWNGRRFRTRRR